MYLAVGANLEVEMAVALVVVIGRVLVLRVNLVVCSATLVFVGLRRAEIFCGVDVHRLLDIGIHRCSFFTNGFLLSLLIVGR